MTIQARATIEAEADRDPDIGSDSSSDSESDLNEAPTIQISAIQYLLKQLSFILRHEPSKHTTAALLPKTSAITLLVSLLPHLSASSLNETVITSILLPLHHITDPNNIGPRSADPTFAKTMQTLTESAHEATATIQRKIGDAAYVNSMTQVSKLVRQRREGRRTKRRIERVAEPEKAARDKKRKAERKRDRTREIARSFRRGRLERR